MITETEAVDAVEQALASAATGDPMGGAMLLTPLITDSIGSAYALIAMLAETASHIARRDQTPGRFQTLVEDVETGLPGSTADLSVPLAFAVDFTTAWANRDHDTCERLFAGLVAASEKSGGEELVDAVIHLFQMATVTATAVIAEERAKARATEARDDAQAAAHALADQTRHTITDRQENSR